MATKQVETKISSTNIKYSSSKGLAQDLLDCLVSVENDSTNKESDDQKQENKILDKVQQSNKDNKIAVLAKILLRFNKESLTKVIETNRSKESVHIALQLLEESISHSDQEFQIMCETLLEKEIKEPNTVSPRVITLLQKLSVKDFKIVTEYLQYACFSEEYMFLPQIKIDNNINSILMEYGILSHNNINQGIRHSQPIQSNISFNNSKNTIELHNIDINIDYRFTDLASQLYHIINSNLSTATIQIIQTYCNELIMKSNLLSEFTRLLNDLYALQSNLVTSNITKTDKIPDVLKFSNEIMNKTSNLSKSFYMAGEIGDLNKMKNDMKTMKSIIKTME